MNVLPDSLVIEVDDFEPVTVASLPLACEPAYDFESGKLIYDDDGNLTYAYGVDAVKVWCYFALMIERYEHSAFSAAYGCEMHSVVGEVITDEYKRAEIVRYVEECLRANPYITGVDVDSIVIDGSMLSVVVRVDTIYEGSGTDVAIAI